MPGLPPAGTEDRLGDPSPSCQWPQPPLSQGSAMPCCRTPEPTTPRTPPCWSWLKPVQAGPSQPHWVLHPGNTSSWQLSWSLPKADPVLMVRPGLQSQVAWGGHTDSHGQPGHRGQERPPSRVLPRGCSVCTRSECGQPGGPTGPGHTMALGQGRAAGATCQPQGLPRLRDPGQLEDAPRGLRACGCSHPGIPHSAAGRPARLLAR